jgi:hypothetical protein
MRRLSGGVRGMRRVWDRLGREWTVFIGGDVFGLSFTVLFYGWIDGTSDGATV